MNFVFEECRAFLQSLNMINNR